MSGVAVRHLLVRRLVHAPARVPGRDGDDAAQSLERRLHTPEAATGERGNRAALRGRGGEERERSEDEKGAFHESSVVRASSPASVVASRPTGVSVKSRILRLNPRNHRRARRPADAGETPALRQPSATLRAHVSRSRLLPLTGILAALAAWQIAVSLRPSLIPGPIAVARGIGELAVRGLLVKYVVASLFRVTWGYLAALVIAVPLGLTLAMIRI